MPPKSYRSAWGGAIFRGAHQLVKLMLSENDPALAAEFIPVLEKEFARIDGQMGWVYPDQFGEQVVLLRSHFG